MSMPRTPTKDHLTPEEQRAWGRSCREVCPRGSHATWDLTDDRDPVELLNRQAAGRLQFLLPIRHARMLVSPFAFYRGSAVVMAADLSRTTSSGLLAQLCGDSHLSNFGVFGSPERSLVFDCNDFDETHRGPWEWDVKRLAVSGVLLARHRGWSPDAQRELARIVGSAYRLSMVDFAGKGRLEVWYSRATDEQILGLAKDPENRATVERQFRKARLNDVSRAVAKYTEVVDGRRRFVHQPPLVLRLDEAMTLDAAAGMHRMVFELFGEYLASLPFYLQVLMGGYEVVDVALKVVGVGSVGTRCFIALLKGRDDDDLLILQVKEADRSVLEPYTEPSEFANEGERVVVGQHLMQAATDQLLGWSRVGDNDYYVRQFRDMKGSVNLERIDEKMAGAYLALCAWTLARAHARSGSRIAMASYLGSGRNFDRAVVEFSMSYSEQVARDYTRFAEAAADGSIPVADTGF